MARGWESKSVEAQIEESQSGANESGRANRPTLEEAQAKRKKANLMLSRARILAQLSSSTNERYSEILRRSLAELDKELNSD